MTHLERKPGAVGKLMTAPRGTVPSFSIYKVMEKMFAIVSFAGTPYVIVKCDPSLAEILRSKYAGVGHRSHLDKRFWISVDLEADVPAKELRRLVDRSYDVVCAGLTRKQSAELASLSPK